MELSPAGTVVRSVSQRRAASPRVPVALVAAVLLASCGASTASQVTTTEADFGRSISIHVGDTVRVDLIDRFSVPGSSIIWTADSSEADVLERTSSTRQNPPGIMDAEAHYVALFRAVGKGQATIVATGATSCEAMNPAYCQQHAGTINVSVT